MNEKVRPHVKAPFDNPEVLVCDFSGRADSPFTSHPEWVSSPIACLDKAVELSPELIVIHFGRGSFKAHQELVELCAVLKHNHYTRNCSILALLHVKHRELLEVLDRVGVDYLRYIGESPPYINQIRQIVDELGPLDRLKHLLTMMCPFLHYSAIDAWRELTLCGAYLDRMVLGGRRLHRVCETKEHLHCEYYLNSQHKNGDVV